ncbi:N-carbamoyl-L-amino acid amidohydrolase [Idiomarina xiamenensis]|nr:N-carbamoyl-L-amino acid amidohydrolase [Idiomarina xiamenensis]
MKRIELDDDLYAYIASHTQQIGESASDILRRLLAFDSAAAVEHADSSTSLPTTASVFDRLNQPDVAAQRSAVGRFLYILSLLYRSHRQDFAKVLQIRGRDRVYFATSEEALLASGNSTNPKQIPDSDYWVVTNNNTTKKKSMLTLVATELGYSPAEAEKIRDFL